MSSEQVAERLYRVQFGTHTRTVPEQDLELLPEDTDPWSDVLKGGFEGVFEGRFEGSETFQKLLTFERLRRPPSRVATTFGTARAKLLPYQFKPLLKFLDNPNQRILIADDVGLGKTVEAGYILKELKARHGLERVLVVVPARLRLKWKTEFERRFDETFEIVSAKEVKDRLIEPLRHGRDLPTFAWIASYESLRHPAITKSLLELEPPIDLVIMDEAHKVRNTQTQQHALARALSQTDAMVLLTATPIQTSRENLFQLLRLLDPVTFVRYEVFEAQLEANRPVVQALAAIRENPPKVDVARECLIRLRDHALTADLTKSGFFVSLLDRLDPVTLSGRGAVVDLQRDISELSLTSQVLSRTRKVEVMPDKPVRQATACKVELTVEERRAYEAIGKITYLINPSQSWGAVMAAMTAVRYAASCLPAALNHFRTKYGQSLDVLCRDNDEDLAEENNAPVPSMQLAEFWEVLRSDLETELPIDTKFAKLNMALEDLWREDVRAQRAPRKVIVFSFFRGTLSYLSSRLGKAGVETRMIHGLVPLWEREQLIDEFLWNPDVRVLVSSEVGSEGLDLQQASVVINYDLPWNPMIVEQRIGRIDRLGQESRVLTILSLVLSNTIEDWILYRLYERIGIFEATLGEIEPILGEQIEKLAIKALRNDLTPQQQERQADLAADAFLREQRQGNTLQEQADQLIAGDQAFLDEIQSLIGERKVPSPKELYNFLCEFIAQRYPGSSFPADALKAIADTALDARLAADLLRELGNTPDVRRIASRVEQGVFPVTFDADVHLRRPYSELISIHHPFVRLVCAFLERQQLHRTFHLRLPADRNRIRNDYLLAVLEFTISGNRARTEIVPIFWELQGSRPIESDASRRMFIQLLDTAESVEGVPSLSRELVEGGIRSLKKHLSRVRAEMKSRETTLQAARAARRRTTQQATLDAKVRAARLRLARLESRHADAFAVRMAKAKLDREQHRIESFLRESGEEGTVSIEEREIAIALVSIAGLGLETGVAT